MDLDKVARRGILTNDAGLYWSLVVDLATESCADPHREADTVEFIM
jgi:hypothetical protein